MSIEAAPDRQQSTSNLRVSEFTALPTPQEMIAELPLDARGSDVVGRGRDEVRAIMDGVDDRLLVIVGPCSIHDPKAGLEYARRLVSQAEKHREDLLIVMRTYFEKPRTTVGWKGLINDPRLDGSHDIAAGLRAARPVPAPGHRTGTAHGHGIPRTDQPAVHGGPRRLGCHRGAHHGKPDPPPARLRPLHADRLQKRDRRRPAGGARCLQRSGRRAGVPRASTATGGPPWSARPATRTPTSSCAAAATGLTSPPPTSKPPPHGSPPGS